MAKDLNDRQIHGASLDGALGIFIDCLRLETMNVCFV